MEFTMTRLEGDIVQHWLSECGDYRVLRQMKDNKILYHAESRIRYVIVRGVLQRQENTFSGVARFYQFNTDYYGDTKFYMTPEEAFRVCEKREHAVFLETI